MTRFFFLVGAVVGALGVGAGAFGAHSLEGRVSPDRLQVFETAVRYQLYHAIALLAVAWAVSRWPGPLVQSAGYCFIGGILLFSGSLYALVLTDTPWLGAVTPLGGVAFIAGWVLLAGAAWYG